MMKIDQHNYFKTIERIQLDKAPKIFQESHRLIVMKTDNGKDWSEYENNKSLRKIFDLTFKKLAELISSKGEDLKGLEESSLLGAIKEAVNFSNKIPEEIRFFKRYLRLNNEKISRGELLNFIDALQKAMLEKRISKTSPYAKYILSLQEQLVAKYNKGDRFITIKIPEEGREKLELITQSEKILSSVRLLKRFVNLRGKNLTRDKAQNLLNEIQRAFDRKEITKGDKYMNLLLEIKTELIQFLGKKQSEIYPVKVSLSGIPQESEAVIKKSTDFVNEKFDTIGFTGKWFDLMGDPSPGFTAMVFGRPKMGKSFLCIDWAGYLATNFGKVLYVAKEEQFFHPLQIKIKEKNVAHENLDLADSLPKDLSGYKFIFIDSVQGQGLTPEQLRELKAKYPGVSFIYVFQVTKAGQFRGANEFQHDVDVVVEIPEKGKAIQYGRFNQGGEMEIFTAEEPIKEAELVEEEAPALMGIQKGKEMEIKVLYNTGVMGLLKKFITKKDLGKNVFADIFRKEQKRTEKIVEKEIKDFLKQMKVDVTVTSVRYNGMDVEIVFSALAFFDVTLKGSRSDLELVAGEGKPFFYNWEESGKVKQGEKKRYDVISPDGFTIRMGVEPFTSMKKAREYFEKWKDRFKVQGHYSSVSKGQIPLRVLADYCEWVEYDPKRLV